MGVRLERKFLLLFKRDIRRNAFSLSLDDFFFVLYNTKDLRSATR